MGERIDSVSCVGLVTGELPFAWLVRTLCCCCFFDFGVLCGAILGSFVVGWMFRHEKFDGETSSRSCCPLHCRHYDHLGVEVKACSS